MAEQTIKFSELPKDVLSKIPFSLRTSGDEHYINDLPPDVQYLIKKYLDFHVAEIKYEDTLDVKPEISIYSDLKTFTNVKDLILHYLKNYLMISLGSYPFDCEFGSALKRQLHTKDSALRSNLVGNEIGLIVDVISSDYDINVRVTNISLTKIESSTHVEYKADLTVEIGEDSFEITV